MLNQLLREQPVPSNIVTKGPQVSVQPALGCPDEANWHLETVRVEAKVQSSMSAEGWVTFRALDNNGAPAGNIDVLLFGNSCSIATTDANGTACLRVFDPIDAHTQQGRNTATIVQEPADEVRGIGVVPYHSTSIELIFRRVER